MNNNNKYKKIIKESYQQIGDAMIAGTIDNMEKYKYMMGQAHAYLKILQDISNLLNKRSKKMKKEQSSNSTPKTKSALLDKYDKQNEEAHQKEVDGYERLKKKNQINYQDQLVGEC